MSLYRLFFLVFILSSCLTFRVTSQPGSISVADVEKVLEHDFNYSELSRDSGISMLNAYADFCLDQGDTCLLIRVLCDRAILYSTTSTQDEGLKSIQEAGRYLETSSCDSRLEIYIDEARVALQQGLIDAKGMSELALNFLKKYRQDPFDSIAYMHFILSTCCETCDTNVSLRYHDTLYEFALKNDYKVFEQKVLINKGAIYAWNGDFDRAKRYFLKATRFNTESDQISHLAVLYNNLAGLSDEPEEVLSYIDSAIYYARLTENLDQLQTFVENKAMYYSMIGEYKKAYVSIYDAALIKDSLLNQEKILAVAEMQEKYEAEKKSNEIKDLRLENLQAETRFQRNRNRMLAGVFLLISLAGFFGTRFYITNKHKNILAEKNLELSIAHERSDQLLLNILPEEVADELKQKGQAEAKLYDLATIMFTDFIDFTKGVTQLSSEQLLEELNFYFRSFDEIIEKYQVEKIKTIGDSYMAVGGLPSPFEESVKNTVLAALEMQEVVNARNRERSDNNMPSFDMRIGVHTGPIVAGIVGVKKFQYDVWGDAVNTASRLENTSEAGKVNISQTTYELIKDLQKEDTNEPLFSFESRGKVEAKGKGELDMYFVSLNLG